jgi:hypothetical protein
MEIERIEIGAVITLNWHGFEDKKMRVTYVWGKTVNCIDEVGKPYLIPSHSIATYEHHGSPGFYIVTDIFPEAVQDDQIVKAGYFNGAYWLLSGEPSGKPITVEDFAKRYSAVRPFTTQNIMKVFDLMLVMLPVQDAPDE